MRPASSSTRDPRPEADVSRGPLHVAIIMDGSGRWAQRRGRSREYGHRAGILAVRRIVKAAIEQRIDVLTLFAFSDENWLRPPREVSALMGAIELNLTRDSREFRRRGVAVRVLGDRTRLPLRVRTTIRKLEAETEGGSRLRLNLALSYGSRSEIVRAARMVADRVARGALDPSEIDEDLLSLQLHTAGIPDPQLLIRTSGEHRISNFLLWQLAHADVHITPVLWPDFSARHLHDALVEHEHRSRRRAGAVQP